LGAFVAEKFNCKIFCSKSRYKRPARASFAPFFRRKPKLENATNMSFGSKRVDWVRSLRKFNCKFFVPKVAKRPPGQVSHSCSVENRNSENATDMSFGSNGVDWVRSLRKFNCKFLFQKSLKRTSGRVSHHSSYRKSRTPKTQEHEFWVKGVDWVRSLRKIQLQDFLFQKSRNGPPERVSHRCSVENRNSENATNMSFGSNGVDWVRSLRKIQLQDFLFQKSLKRTSQASFAQFFVENETLKTQQT
jgi:hypothetical protein